MTDSPNDYSDVPKSSSEGGEEEEIPCVVSTFGMNDCVSKVIFYILILAGAVLYVIGLLMTVGIIVTGNTGPILILVGTFVFLLSGIFKFSFATNFSMIKAPVRLVSFLIMLGAIIFEIIVLSKKSPSLFLKIFAAACLVAATLWYFMTYFKRGHDACLACCLILWGCEKRVEGVGVVKANE